MFILKKQLKPTCTAHYLGKGFPRACKNLHGHNYRYEIELGIKDLNQYDMGIDFADIKQICDDWLQQHFDHKTLFSDFQEEAMAFWDKMGWEYEVLPIKNGNTTAENMACYVANVFFDKIYLICHSLQYVTIHIWETDGSQASYTKDLTDEL